MTLQERWVGLRTGRCARAKTKLRGYAAALLCLTAGAALIRAQTPENYDVVIYGGSSAGVIAAVQAARMGKSTVLISAQHHVGGMTASGLGTSDVGNAATIGGLAFNFYERVFQHYHLPATAADSPGLSAAATTTATPYGVQFDFEPHVAEVVFDTMLRDAGATVVYDEQLDRVTGVERSGAHLTALRMKSGRVFNGLMFIDATYEGDLLAAAGVRYRVGREDRTAYNESYAGVYRDTSLAGEVDPYRMAGDPSSGLLPGVEPEDPGPNGTGDSRVQQFNLRLCLTNNPADRLPIERPANYDRANYELLRRRVLTNPKMPITDVIKVQPLPGGKADINATGSFSTDMAGAESARWVEASDEERGTIQQKYRDYTQGLLWFLVHDPGVPLQIRTQAARWGLAADEFTDTDHWPWQLYVREARRMVGTYTITQHDCERTIEVPDSIALGSYGMDSHKVTLFIDRAGVLNTDGYFFGSVSPYPISYRAIIPSAWEGDNLLVPICLSATHVAFNSIRMEPVYMMLGQSAATAACLAIDRNTTVQRLNYAVLARRLVADGQILRWDTVTGRADSAFTDQPDATPAARVNPSAGRTPTLLRRNAEQ